MINQKELPKISIIICVKNSVKTIEKAIKSLLIQNYPNLEFIVIDGCSNDGTIEVINRYKEFINKLIIEKDSGSAEANNKGIRNASSDIIGFLNADDFYESDILLKAGTEFSLNPNLDIVSFRYRVINENNDILKETTINEIAFDNDLPKCLGINAKFFKKSLFLKYGYVIESDDKNRNLISNDIEYMIRFKIMGYEGKDIDWIGYNYMSHDNSLTFNNSFENLIRLNEDMIFIAKIFINNQQLIKNNLLWKKIFIKWKIRHRYRIIILNFKLKKFDRMLKNLMIGFKENNKIKFFLYVVKRILKKKFY